MNWPSASYIAIGDSFTEGCGDPYPHLPGQPEVFRGWADRLALVLSAHRTSLGLAPLKYANLAIRGRKLADVLGPQLETALAQRPELISLVGGGNDMLRPRVDLDALAQQLDAAVRRIRNQGISVLLATPVDPAGGGSFALLRARHATHTANLLGIAAAQGCAVINQWRLPQMLHPVLWAPDRLHLSAEGHRRISQVAAHLLGSGPSPLDEDGRHWREALPRYVPDKSRRRQANRQWAREHLAPWVHRRLTGRSSGDGISPKRPVLVPVVPTPDPQTTP